MGASKVSIRHGAAVAAALVLAGVASAETLDEVVARHVEALGGVERWRAVESVEIVGDYTSFSWRAPFKLQRKRPDLYRFEHQQNRRDAVFGHDGTSYWWIHGMMFPWATVMPPSQAAVARADAEIESPLLDWRAKEHRLELAGREELEGQPVWHLVLHRAAGGDEDWYLDTATGLPVARRAPGSDFGQPMPRMLYYSDWRPVGGLRFPFRVEEEWGTRNAVYEARDVRLGVALADEVFRMPVPDGMERFVPLAGEWRVKIASRDDPRAPWKEAATTSRVDAVARGGLLVERLSYELEGQRFELLRSLSYDRFRRRYRATSYDDLTTYQKVLEGELGEDGKLALTDHETKTSWEAFGTKIHSRLVYYDVTPTGFTIDEDVSFDEGANYFTATRYTYSR